jgi:hypothetical protein
MFAISSTAVPNRISGSVAALPWEQRRRDKVRDRRRDRDRDRAPSTQSCLMSA